MPLSLQLGTVDTIAETHCPARYSGPWSAFVKASVPHAVSSGRGRDGGCPPPPAQIPTCSITACVALYDLRVLPHFRCRLALMNVS
jgi:hypothetical protein